MSIAYHAIGWNRQKRLYDFTLAGALALGFLAYAGAVWIFHPLTTAETLIIRFSAISALVLLHVILAIGPLARLDRRFLPLLYNRRHLGVTMFFLALLHGVFAIVQFHGGGNRSPLASVLTAYQRDYVSAVSHPSHFAHFPFETLGLAALVIFFLMAATSHDFWLKNLGPSFWKLLHMLVYAAYGLVLAHVFLGALQSERSPIFPALLGLGFVMLAGLHGASYWKERKMDRQRASLAAEGFVRVASRAALQADRGHIVLLEGERVALFLHGGKIHAISNVCRHQGGPLGEGRVVNGCLTCPWHGYQYRLEDGCSPPPFTEVAPTYAVRVADDEVYVSKNPLPLGTRSEGVPVGPPPEVSSHEDFYIGWQSKTPASLSRFLKRAIIVLGAGVPLIFFTAARWQNPVDAGAFEFGVERTLEGLLYEEPVPFLQSAAGNLLLVGAGKFGPPAQIAGHNGQRVKFSGSLIHRNGMAMIEMNRPASFQVLDAAPRPLPPVVALGTAVCTGELVDTKCFFGVMRPATGKVHRACAIRCLSGGAPPGLLVRDSQGNAVVVLLAGQPGQPLAIDAELAARILEVRGDLELHNGTPVLRVAKWTVRD
jgi:sulfoxide reductase heme-binding subunit YedZ